MGHYLSEMQFEGDKERDKRIRTEKLYGKVKEMGLGCFKAGELGSLLKLLDLDSRHFRSNHRDLEVLERAVARNEKLLESLPGKKK